MENEKIIITYSEETELEKTEEFQILTKNHPKNIHIIKRRGFDGVSPEIIAMVSITSIVAGAVASVIKEAIRARRDIVIKYKKVEIKGERLKDVVMLLEKLEDKY